MPPAEYVYCIVPSTFDPGTGTSGIDAHPIRLVRAGDVAAVVSTLDDSGYTATDIERRVTDLEWLKPRAVAHDHVVTWSSDRGPTLPMPMWSLFSDANAIIGTLRERSHTLAQRLEKVAEAREYTVRLFVRSDVLRPALATLSPRLAELERSIEAASPGQAYLLQRKIDGERKLELRNVVRAVAHETYTTLAEYSDDAVHDPIGQNDNDTHAVLNASFLVATTQYDYFRRALTDLVIHYQHSGFQFDFTGPWPPYHFVHGN